MNDATKAVFLSYAREDTDAARRIADALRSHGVEVWFDQSELRGGDAWDAKIRKQINDCTLFLPIISKHTQERGKGYFRLEWKLAVEQTHLMAEGMAFLAPVVVDDTPESGALVPPEFMRVQWTRLPGALPTPPFVEQVKRLLSGERGAAAKTAAGFAEARRPGSATPATAKTIPGWMWAVLAAVLVIVAAGIVLLRKPEPPAAAPVPMAAATPPAPAAPRVSDKSIAVLPFTNMSEDKENAFFTDGIHEDILTNLALIHELRVVSRTSVMPYRTTTKSIRQIAQELGVTYILEGSVQRSGNKVRVTGQLIHAASDEHVWAKAYDRDLTDVFAIQSELSQQIAAALKTALSPEEKVLLARRPTENPAAYDLYLRARDVRNREGISPAGTVHMISLLQNAVELDPAFAQAWGELAAACAFSYFTYMEGMDATLARAKAAIDRAVQLAPGDPSVIESEGTYYYYGYRDYTRANEFYEQLARLQPNAPVVFNSLALIQRRQGRWAQSLANSRRATELDPANLGYLRVLVDTLRSVRRWDEVLAVQRRMVALLPDNLFEAGKLTYLQFLADGSTAAADAFLARLSPEQLKSPRGLEMRKTWAAEIGNYAESSRLDRLQPYFEEDGDPHWQQALFAALALYAQGDQAAARARLGDFPAELRRQLEREPKNVQVEGQLAAMEFILGDPPEAMRCIDRAAEQLPESRDALDGTLFAGWRALLYDWTGDKERALAEYARLLRVPQPYLINVHEMKRQYSTLHGDPRFEALLNDPANNAPLF